MTHPNPHPLASVKEALEEYACGSETEKCWADSISGLNAMLGEPNTPFCHNEMRGRGCGKKAAKALALVNQMMGAEMKTPEGWSNEWRFPIKDTLTAWSSESPSALIGFINAIQANAYAAGLAAQPDAKQIRKDILEKLETLIKSSISDGFNPDSEYWDWDNRGDIHSHGSDYGMHCAVKQIRALKDGGEG